jgi:hypothetical protein
MNAFDDEFERDEGRSWQDTALVCEKGHLVNGSFLDFPAENTKFCEKCGAINITKCPSCNESIRGNYHIPGILGGGIRTPPDFCHNCGKPYPWTKELIEAANRAIDKAQELDDEEKEDFVKAIEQVRGDSSISQIAAHRIKGYIQKLKRPSVEVIKEVITKVASEAATKIILGK